MCLLYPLLSQLGQAYKNNIFLPFTFIKHSECSGCVNLCKMSLAFAGGLHGSPVKQCFTTSHNSSSRPVSVNRLDTHRSYVIHVLNNL